MLGNSVEYTWILPSTKAYHEMRSGAKMRYNRLGQAKERWGNCLNKKTQRNTKYITPTPLSKDRKTIAFYQGGVIGPVRSLD